jgi:CRP/FNR family cyclic AMP-dependent transcriptional regulator
MPDLPAILAVDDCFHCKIRPSSPFCNLSVAALADYNSLGSLETMPIGTILFREGDLGLRVLVICAGRAKLSCESKGGRVLNLKLAVSGDVLGLSAILSGTTYESTAETIETSYLKNISKMEFLGFLARQAEGGLHAAQRLSEDYRLALQGARRLALSRSALGKIAGILLDWGRASSSGSTKMRFIMAMSHEDLAEFAGTSRETVSRSLASLQRNKAIAIHGATIHILLPRKLAALAA